MAVLRYLLFVAVVVVALTFSGAIARSGPIVCEEDSCTTLPSPPDDPTPGTLVPGPGNPPVHFPSRNAKKPSHGKKQHPKRSHHEAKRQQR